jgi:CheY-like chemotaxis protein
MAPVGAIDKERIVSKKRMLLAEGDLDAQKTLAEQLSAFQVDVDTAPDGPEAIKVARVHDHAVILANLTTPGILAGIERIRAEGNETPVVIFSANAQPEDKSRCHQSGVNEFVPKALDEAEMERLMRRWVHKGDEWLD